MQYPNASPNNHILNTLLTKFVLLFDKDPWAVRLPNILFFIVYTFAVYRIIKVIFGRSSLLFIFAACLFIANPYLLDFFGLSRGYGISVSLCLLSFSYLLNGFKENNTRHIWLSYGFALLASYAHFTLLVFWTANFLLILSFFLIRFKNQGTSILKPIFALLSFSMVYVALIINPLRKMHNTDQYVHWSSNGFIEDTIKPLVQHSVYFTEEYSIIRIISYGIIGIIISSLVLVFIRLIRSASFNELIPSPLVIGTSLFVLTIGVNLMQTWIMHTPNLNGRTALFFYPLTIVLFLLLISEIGIRIRPYLLIPFSLLGLYNLFLVPTKYVSEWEYDRYTYEVQELLLERCQQNKKISLSVHWLFHPSFEFYIFTGKTPWLSIPDFNYVLNPETDSEFYYVRKLDEEILNDRFTTFHRFDNGNVLMQRNVLSTRSK